MTAGPVSDYTAAAALQGGLPAATRLRADRVYDAGLFREGLKNTGVTPCIPDRKSRATPVKYDKRRYKRRNRIEIIFGRLKDWLIVGKTDPGLFSDPPRKGRAQRQMPEGLPFRCRPSCNRPMLALIINEFAT